MGSPLHPAVETYLGLPGYTYGWAILIIGLALFCYTLQRRWVLIRSGKADPRFSLITKRLRGLFVYGIFQKRQPRYSWAGVIHILIFWGFVVLGLRSLDLVTQGLGLPLLRPLMETGFGPVYNTLKDVFELIVLGTCVWAILRRALIRHSRYEGSHTFEAHFVLGLIAFLMLTDMFYDGSAQVLGAPDGGWLPASHGAAGILWGSGPGFVRGVHAWSYWLHLLTFFFFLNFLPLGKHFHIITALPNVFLRKLTKGAIKPARWDAADLEELDSLGIEGFEDFTWKHILDCFTCTECGRCSDNCPAQSIGRPLSPKMITLKVRDYGYDKVPVFPFRQGKAQDEAPSLIGEVVSHDEIWSCTTCGACEEECPVFIEYIDKMIDMRRHLVESAQNPSSFNKVFMNVEKTGNPFGKPAGKRAEWLKELETIPVKLLKQGDEVDVLYFVDSYGSFDPAAQRIASAVVKGLYKAGIDFGILGPREKDSGHQVRRMGEEGLFQLLMEENMETLESVGFNTIITTDPHAFNTLKKDYPGSLNVLHYTQFFQPLIEQGLLKPGKALKGNDICTYHDPCYLGRHNGVYNAPRRILHSIPGLRLVEMARARDRSFCCGGGDIVLWHEIEQEEMRMAEMRVQMARAAGATVMVTACPFCFIHFEDAIKTGGLEEHIRVVDLMELFISTEEEA